ncbi:uncharacterized protein LOC134539842 isoform X1 [Bacillus rossius redtenbacheri]|uniref:uncharacterized protein LOC134539842 isoform X1 n=1 Tax=Bacillus rossius redtenbacheri TaxID=93214 RepID=UPI002FDEA327
MDPSVRDGLDGVAAHAPVDGARLSPQDDVRGAVRLRSGRRAARDPPGADRLVRAVGHAGERGEGPGHAAAQARPAPLGAPRGRPLRAPERPGAPGRGQPDDAAAARLRDDLPAEPPRPRRARRLPPAAEGARPGLRLLGAAVLGAAGAGRGAGEAAEDPRAAVRDSRGGAQARPSPPRPGEPGDPPRRGPHQVPPLLTSTFPSCRVLNAALTRLFCRNIFLCFNSSAAMAVLLVRGGGCEGEDDPDVVRWFVLRSVARLEQKEVDAALLILKRLQAERRGTVRYVLATDPCLGHEESVELLRHFGLRFTGLKRTNFRDPGGVRDPNFEVMIRCAANCEALELEKGERRTVLRELEKRHARREERVACCLQRDPQLQRQDSIDLLHKMGLGNIQLAGQ